MNHSKYLPLVLFLSIILLAGISSCSDKGIGSGAAPAFKLNVLSSSSSMRYVFEEGKDYTTPTLFYMPVWSDCDYAGNKNRLLSKCTREKLDSYLNSNLNTPKSALKEKKEGIAKFRLSMNDEGAITGVSVLEGLGNDEMDQEAQRLMEGLPAWNPGLFNEKTPIGTEMDLAIRFDYVLR